MKSTNLARLCTVAVAGALALAGCSSSNDATPNSAATTTPKLVTSTNVWASVASAVAGDKASVTALFSDPTGDPHDFEPSAADTAKVVDADVVLLNGAHYDEYMEKAAQDVKGTIINAATVMTDNHLDATWRAAQADAGDQNNEADTNEHVFYNLATVAKVADAIADALAKKDPADSATFHANAAAFTAKIDDLRHTLAAIKKDDNGAKVAQTEPLAGYLLAEAGLIDSSPVSFTAAVEQDQSPSAADRAAMEKLLTGHTVRVFIYNTQAVDSVTEALLATAKSANVAVVKFTETLPQDVTSYLDWQQGQITALRQALTPSAG
ncbi:MAG: zinc ABC transporter substrate-binding protein [Gordonia sp. (in: high G+C Gram-positive bacteria)]